MSNQVPYSEYNVEDRDRVVDCFDSDIRWVMLMNNKQFITTIMTLVKKEAGPRGKDVRFAGAAIVGGPNDDLNELIDDSTLDIVSPKLKTRMAKKRSNQHTFSSLHDFFKARSPQEKKCNVYFFGDAYSTGGSSEFVAIHWNCCIVDARNNRHFTVWYDPSEALEHVEEAYNFEKIKKNNILRVLAHSKYPIITFKTPQRAQQACAEHPGQDVFCQTWVLLFASVYINDACAGFARIDFAHWQTQPLKMWAKCLATRMPKSWQPTLNDPMYGGFFGNCRRIFNSEDGPITRLETLPEMRSMESVGSSELVPCVYSVITHYLGLEKLYIPIKPCITRDDYEAALVFHGKKVDNEEVAI